MDGERTVQAMAFVCIALAFSTMCVSIKACNDSDNLVHKQQTERGCAYFGDGKFDCRSLNKGEK